MVNAGNTTVATVSGLIEGGTYYFAATAYDTSALESDFSSENNYTAPITTKTRPMLNSLANVTITVTVGDGAATPRSSFQLSVLPKPAPPSGLHVAQVLP